VYEAPKSEKLGCREDDIYSPENDKAEKRSKKKYIQPAQPITRVAGATSQISRGYQRNSREGTYEKKNKLPRLWAGNEGKGTPLSPTSKRARLGPARVGLLGNVGIRQRFLTQVTFVAERQGPVKKTRQGGGASFYAPNGKGGGPRINLKPPFQGFRNGKELTVGKRGMATRRKKCN